MKKIIFLLFSFHFALFTAFAQDQQFVDSLLNKLKTHQDDTTGATILLTLSKTFVGNDAEKATDYANKCLVLSEKLGFSKGIGYALNSLGSIAEDNGNYLASLELYNKSLSVFKKISHQNGIASCYNGLGIVYYNLGNYPEALNNYFKSLRMAEETGNKDTRTNAYNNIGLIYREQKNFQEALRYYNMSLELAKELGNKKNISASFNNIGIICREQGNYADALKNYIAAMEIKKEIGDRKGIAKLYNHIGIVYNKLGKYDTSIANQFEALRIQEEIQDKRGQNYSLKNIGNTYLQMKKYPDAESYLRQALALSKEIGTKDVEKECLLYFSQLDSARGNYKQSLDYYKQFISIRETLLNNENTKKIVQTQMQYDFEKKQDSTKAIQDKKDAIAQKEMQKQKLVRNGFMGGFAVVLLFAGVFFTQRNKIKKGKQRSDELLLNILPSEVAEELKAKGSADAKQFDDVTVMFTDFKNFTQISEKLSPTELVNEIHTCFKAFDNIIGKHNIEKIKTIGDSYMCAGGLPVTNKTNAVDVVSAALEIQAFMQQHSEKRKSEGREIFEIRIGVHTGPVVAGIVGVKKFAYDIWGDTVNIASRMESSGEAGKVNISGSTYELVKDKFNCKYRGEIETKGKGMMQMYFVEV